MKTTAIIVCNGTVDDYSYYHKYFTESNFVISVDGGAAHLRKFGIIPDVLLGDFDSIDQADFDFFKALSVEILKFPPQKNMTDTELAIELAISKGYKTLIFIGALGTRFDHSLSNIFILKSLLEKGILGIIANEKNEIILIKDRIKITKEEDAKVTLLPMTETVEGVTTKGLFYPLFNEVLEMGSSRGVSNEFVSDIAEISISKGLLLVIKSKD